jgi:hypothetical protein
MKQGLDGKPFKKVRPRRTVDYMGGMGRYALVCRYYTLISMTRKVHCSSIAEENAT